MRSMRVLLPGAVVTCAPLLAGLLYSELVSHGIQAFWSAARDHPFIRSFAAAVINRACAPCSYSSPSSLQLRVTRLVEQTDCDPVCEWLRLLRFFHAAGAPCPDCRDETERARARERERACFVACWPCVTKTSDSI